MSFKDEYTTMSKVLKEESIDPKDLSKDSKLEKDKVPVSNDFYMLGEMLECLINKMVK
jgi:hypothetical protein